MKRNAFAALGLFAGYSKGIRTSSSTISFPQRVVIHQQRLLAQLVQRPSPSLLLSVPRTSYYSTTSTTTLSMSATTGASPEAGMTTEAAIHANLQESFAPIEHLEVLNESHTHNVPANSETHFKVIIVSPAFETVKSPIQRHRLVHKALHDQLMDNGGTIHALSIIAKSPSQWQASNKTVPPSPKCKGGDGSLPKK